MTSYGELWRARIEMMRPLNSLMTALAVLVGIWLVDPAWNGHWIAAPLAGFLITGYGNILNDLQDRHVDRKAHPQRPLPAGRIRAVDAQAFALLLLGFGLLEAWVAAGWPLVLFAAINAAALWIYEGALKQRGLAGNILVALLVASAFAFGAFSTGAPPAQWGPVWWLAAMAALANLGRELLKDLEDVQADQATRRTFPSRRGRTASLAVSGSAVLAAVALSGVYLGTKLPAWPAAGILLLVMADLLFVWSVASSRSRLHQAQLGLKGAMVLALAAFSALAWL